MERSHVKEWKVSDVMTRQVTTVCTEDIVTKVHGIFSKQNIHHLPVLDLRDEIVGIISRIDLRTASAGFSIFKQHKKQEYNEALFRSLRAVEIMTANPEIIAPDVALNEAILKFKENIFRALPVVKNNKVVGIITPYDIMIYFSENCKS